jgi:hypothetical protein
MTGRTGSTQGEMPVIKPPTSPISTSVITASMVGSQTVAGLGVGGFRACVTNL